MLPVHHPQPGNGSKHGEKIAPQEEVQPEAGDPDSVTFPGNVSDPGLTAEYRRGVAKNVVDLREGGDENAAQKVARMARPDAPGFSPGAFYKLKGSEAKG